MLKGDNTKLDKRKKLRILFYAWAGKDWMGGIYYVRNMIFALLQNRECLNKIQIFLMIDRELQEEFSDMMDYQEITVLYKDQYVFPYQMYLKVKNYYYNHIKNIKAHKNLLAVVDKYDIDVIFPMCIRDDIYCEKGIMWIPDMQHIHYPEFFPGDALAIRNNDYRYLAEKHAKMILSSQSVKKDYELTYPQYAENVYVVP